MKSPGSPKSPTRPSGDEETIKTIRHALIDVERANARQIAPDGQRLDNQGQKCCKETAGHGEPEG